jgi:hypothetical protein
MIDFPLVCVMWDDAWGSKEDEVTLEDVGLSHKPTIVTTVGWLVHQDDAGLSIFNEKYENKFRGRTFIPAALVKSVTPVIKPRKRKEVP